MGGGVDPVQILRPENQGSQRLREGEDRGAPHLTQAESRLSFHPLFVLVRPSMDWMMPVHIVEGNLL